MKLNLVKDKAGKVIATYEKAQGDGPSVTPELEHGHTVHEVEVAENYMHSIERVYDRHSR